MNTPSKLILAGVVFAGAAWGALTVFAGGSDAPEVRVGQVESRDLVETVTASGNIRAVTVVDMSSDISARVVELLVAEGDDVEEGQILLRLEPDEYEAAVERGTASLAQAIADLSQQEENLVRAQRDLDILIRLKDQEEGLVSTQQVQNARTDVALAESSVESASHGVAQARAALRESEDRLGKTLFIAPMAGRVTRLNVEVGETVVFGTMNNAGSLVLTISDLSVMEVRLKVDETEVSRISMGDSALVRMDAFPGETFVGRVTEIGNSAVTPPTDQPTGQQAAIDFAVVLTLDPTTAPLRPDLSATADIITDSKEEVLSVPIISLTLRQSSGPESAAGPTDETGVFLVRDGAVEFVPVETGIAGREHFEAISGVSEGDRIVVGPYQTIRELQSGIGVTELEEPGPTQSAN